MPDWSKLAGKFIALDGGEGCGKSTQARRLEQFLADDHHLPVTLVRDPGATAIGEKIRHLLLDPASAEMAMRCEMLCYMAARAQMVAEKINPALLRGDVVLCDRFISSTLAYQLGGDGLSRDEILAVGTVATAGRWPGLTLILDVPLEISQKRLQPKFETTKGPQKDRIEQRPAAYHERVRHNFLEQAMHDPQGYAVIDASGTPDEVFGRVLEAVEQLL